jgi:hypothetical protein|tara:strand:- start:917 stop:1141 length:225 start_codon:yes stop_codon:yes gene_type:complete
MVESFIPVAAIVTLRSTTSTLAADVLTAVMVTHHTIGRVGKSEVRNMEKQEGGEERKVPEGGGHAVDVKNFHNV